MPTNFVAHEVLMNEFNPKTLNLVEQTMLKNINRKFGLSCINMHVKSKSFVYINLIKYLKYLIKH